MIKANSPQLGGYVDFSRRGFINTIAAGTYLSTFSHSSYASNKWLPRQEDLIPGPVFRHGVASGDPLQNRVILWTRVTPIHGKSFAKVEVIVATDPTLKDIVCKESQFTSERQDFTSKFDAYNLKPGTTYYYQFSSLGETSPIGKTKTLPSETDRVRLAVASCSNLPAGYFGAYAQLAKKENIDAVLHLGDYIYEYANAEYGDGSELNRIPSPDREITSLSDYRTRHAQYKMDVQLQEAHKNHPWIVIWDDHEVANDSYEDGAQNHQETDGRWQKRKRSARKAYFEWMPIRDHYGSSQRSGKIFRRFRFGNLMQLDMLDTRLFGREKQVPAIIDPFTRELLVDPRQIPELLVELNRSGRQLLGKQQENWLYKQIEMASKRNTTWQILGQQIMMGQLQLPLPKPFPEGTRVPLNTDQWDGYADVRNNLLKYLAGNNINNTIVLTGDIHSSWFNDIALNPYDRGKYDPLSGKGSRAVEFVTPAITSPFFTKPGTPPEVIKAYEEQIKQNNPHTHFVDFENRGYMIIDIDSQRARGEWYHMSSVKTPNPVETLAAVVEVIKGSNHGVQVL